MFAQSRFRSALRIRAVWFRLFTVHIFDSQGCSFFMQKTKILIRLDAQADLSLRWKHMSEGTFSPDQSVKYDAACHIFARTWKKVMFSAYANSKAKLGEFVRSFQSFTSRRCMFISGLGGGGVGCGRGGKECVCCVCVCWGGGGVGGGGGNFLFMA